MSPELEQKLSGTLLYVKEANSFTEWLPSSPGVEATIYRFKDDEGINQNFIIRRNTGVRFGSAKSGDSINIYKFKNSRIIIEVKGKDFPHFLSHYYDGFITKTSEYGETSDKER